MCVNNPGRCLSSAALVDVAKDANLNSAVPLNHNMQWVDSARIFVSGVMACLCSAGETLRFVQNWRVSHHHLIHVMFLLCLCFAGVVYSASMVRRCSLLMQRWRDATLVAKLESEPSSSNTCYVSIVFVLCRRRLFCNDGETVCVVDESLEGKPSVS